MDQPPVDNQTDFVADPHVLCDRDGERLVTIIKATFEIAKDGRRRGSDGTFELAPKDKRRGIRSADVPWGEPSIPSILYPADLCIRKVGTDVIVSGIARAPEGRPIPAFDAGVRVGQLSKAVRIVGARTWLPNGAGMSKPEPVDELAVRWDFAWGGRDDSEPTKIVEEPRNPVGRGKVRNVASLGGAAAPQIEMPGAPIDDASKDHVPAGLSAIGRSFVPRRNLFGTYDKAWLDDHAPLLPTDFDDRANSCASPGLLANPSIRGGEEGAVMNLLLGGGTTTFVLPKVPIEVVFEVDGREPEIIAPPLDTLLFDTLPIPGAPPLTLEMVWRASIVAPRKLKSARIVVKERK